MKRPTAENGSLRSQLLHGVAVLVALALLALAVAMLAWMPRVLSPQVLVASVLSLITLDVLLVLGYGDQRLRRLFIRPVERMVQQTEAIAEGAYERRLEPGGADELRRLAESVNRMADRLIDHQAELAENVRSLDATNRELSLARRELIQSEKLAAVGRMAAGVAHEIGNPLGAIFGYLDVARRRGGDPEWIEAMRSEATRIDRVVRGLIDFAKPARSASCTFGVNEVVRDTITLLQRQGRLKIVRVETDLELPGPRVRGDPAHLEQILVNLLLNADDAIRAASAPGRIRVRSSTEEFSKPVPREPVRRATDPEGIDYSHLRRHRVDPDALERLEPGEPVVRIEVTDNGVGIGEDVLESVFEPFFTTKEPGRGTGLGLAVSARIAETMGGGMIAESRPSVGTRFTLVLPQDRSIPDTSVVEGVA